MNINAGCRARQCTLKIKCLTSRGLFLLALSSVMAPSPATKMLAENYYACLSY
ncbi:hypothetical protein IMY05_006G0142000 [Salix suchowensis]|nr:hypothetical protein IMY05_006G0142000 [Salix suchowensis]